MYLVGFTIEVHKDARPCKRETGTVVAETKLLATSKCCTSSQRTKKIAQKVRRAE